MHEKNTNQEDSDKGILWFIAVVNSLTLILLAIFVAMSWNVVTAKESQQQAIEKQPAQAEQSQPKQPIQQEKPAQPLASQPLADKPELSGSEKECINKCVQGGEIQFKCAEECGIELPPKR